MRSSASYLRSVTTFTHAEGMVDVSSKVVSKREAHASCSIILPKRIVDAIFSPCGTVNQKGNIIHTARLAGISGSKKTADLIPLCHQVPLSHVSVDFTRDGPERIRVTGSAKCVNQTGVEMEALTAVSISALTVYDMSKSALKGSSDKIIITDIQLDSKSVNDTAS